MNFSIIPDALFQINKETKTVDLGDRLGIEVIDTEMITLESLLPSLYTGTLNTCAT